MQAPDYRAAGQAAMTSHEHRGVLIHVAGMS
jgi:hypothetical protein